MLYQGTRIKYLTAARLIELLRELPPDYELMPNACTLNLSILKDADVIGQVCFLQDGEVEFFNTQDD